MTRFGWITTSVIIVASAGILLLVVTLLGHRPQPSPAIVATTTDSVPLMDPTALAIYTSGTYGFSFFYPATATVTDQFTQKGVDQNSWRENAIATGTRIARVATDGGTVQIGLSQASKELSACVKAGPAEQSQGDTTIGSTTWNTYSFDKLGTDVEQHVVSYRTVHDRSCFALEVFTPRGDASTTAQQALDAIVQSFIFAQP